MKCEYSGFCHKYTEDSFTCRHDGGNYCGAYRKISEEVQLA